MDPVISPAILYAALGLGAIGVAAAMPRRRLRLQALGGLLAAIALGGVLLALGLAAGEHRPQVFFYIFAVIALAASLRVITHHRPVYAALHFVLSILSTAGLFLLLAAEFMTFALVIIYAGAILITYLFVIMLATQAPAPEDLELLNEYDVTSREPIVSTIIGFTLLAALTGMLSLGTPDLDPPSQHNPYALLDRLPRKVESALIGAGLPPGFEVQRNIRAQNTKAPIALLLTVPERQAVEYQALIDDPPPSVAAMGPAYFMPNTGDDLDGTYTLALENLPEDLQPGNIESIGYALVGEHPLSLELAGVILLLAMLGAVVLARKQSEIEEGRKAAQARGLGLGAAGGRFAQ